MRNVIILGSGRSGTSMLAGSLKNAGYFFGENADYLGQNKANPKGYFEDLEVNTINEDIIRLILPVLPENLRKIFFPSYTFYRSRWLASIPLNTKIKTKPSIENRIKSVIKRKPYCLKDPRFSYTLPAWEKHLKNTSYLVIYRNPILTAKSIVRECKENPALKNLKIDENKALRIWEYMYSHIIKNFQKSSTKNYWFFVHYDQIFDSGKMCQLEKFLNAKIDINFPDKKISRSAQTSTYNYNPAIDLIYSELNKLSNYKPFF